MECEMADRNVPKNSVDGGGVAKLVVCALIVIAAVSALGQVAIGLLANASTWPHLEGVQEAFKATLNQSVGGLLTLIATKRAK